MRLLLAIALAASVPVRLAAQSWHHKHSFTVGAGAAQPRAHLAGQLSDSAVLTIGYGYRLHRYLQADLGLDTIFYAARVRDFLETGAFGPLRIRDYQFLIPFGARAVAPLDRGRFLFSAGGGGVRFQYTELLRQPSDYYDIDCYVCRSRGGWGYYGLASGSVALDRRRHFRLGVTGKVYQGYTRGDSFGPLPPSRTRDRWANVTGEFGFSF
jgi:hypothetical protein